MEGVLERGWKRERAIVCESVKASVCMCVCERERERVRNKER